MPINEKIIIERNDTVLPYLKEYGSLGHAAVYTDDIWQAKHFTLIQAQNIITRYPALIAYRWKAVRDSIVLNTKA